MGAMRISSAVFWPNKELGEFIFHTSKSFPPGLRVLDIGCGTMPYKKHFSQSEYVGLDVLESGAEAELKTPDIWFDGVTVPFANASADVIILTEVMEHARHPEGLLAESSRVLRQGGHLIVTTPFLYPEHEQPFDFWRWTTFGLSEALREQGFEVVHLGKRATGYRAWVTLTNQQVAKTLSRIPLLAGIHMMTFGAISNAVGFFFRPDPNQSFFMGLNVLARKV